MFLLPVLQRLLRHPSARRRQRSRRLAAPLYLERLEDRSLLNSATFSGTAFTVGSTITPTSTTPQAEDTIAVSPVDSRTLVATIIDASIARPGYPGTIKYAYSTNNGHSVIGCFIGRSPKACPPSAYKCSSAGTPAALRAM